MRLDLEDPGTLERLLGRPVRPLLTVAQREALAGRRVLITGAGGSVGSELVSQLAGARPKALVLADHSELALVRVERTLRERWPGVELRPTLCDVTRGASVRRLCRSVTPDVVYHAAAYKHVTMIEGAVDAAVETNVLGSYYTAQAARACGARFVLISTDKAARPRSVMGASKRLAERLTLSLGDRTFRPAVVRFGNVLGSSGSVAELMQHWVEGGQPVTVSHPRASRFFMTVGEAATLVMLVGLVARAPGVYWLEPGEPIEIVQLARRFIDLAVERGARPVPITFTGLRDGEKLTEEFPTSEVVPFVTGPFPIYRLRPRASLPDPMRLVRRLRRHVSTGDTAGSLETLTAEVPEFVPSPRAVQAARDTAAFRAA